MIELRIQKLVKAANNLTESYDIEVPVFDDTEFQILPNQTLRIDLHKIQDGLSLHSPKQTIKGIVTCARTLEEFEYHHQTMPFEMQAYLKIPEDIEPDDVLKIDTKNMVLDLEPFVREAIFISLPYRFIKNPDTDSKPENQTKSYKPFSNLKDLM